MLLVDINGQRRADENGMGATKIAKGKKTSFTALTPVGDRERETPAGIYRFLLLLQPVLAGTGLSQSRCPRSWRKVAENNDSRKGSIPLKCGHRALGLRAAQGSGPVT